MKDKSILDSLNAFCDNDNEKLDELLNNFIKYFENPAASNLELQERRRVLRKKFDKTFFELGEDKDSSAAFELKNTNYLKYAALFCSFFDIPKDKFELDKSPHLKIALTENERSDISIIPLRGLTVNRATWGVAEKQYKKKSEEFLTHIKNRLYVYDYLDRFDGEEKTFKIAYAQIHDDIFTEIYDKLKSSLLHGKPQISYCRVLALPNRRLEDVYISDILLLTKNVLEKCSMPLFKHIYTCLNKFRNYSNMDEENTDEEGFYMLGFSPRNYQFSFTDKGAYCLTEHYRFNRKGFCKPDLLFVEEGKGPINELKDMYQEAAEKMFDLDYAKKLTMPLLKKVLKGDLDSLRFIKEHDKEYTPKNLWEQKLDFILTFKQ